MAFYGNNTIMANASFMRFQDQTLCWMEDVPVLFVRSSYEVYFEKIVNSPRKSWIVQGTPGIGKSLFGIWLIKELIRRNIEELNFSILYVDVNGNASQFVLENGVPSSYKCERNNLPESDYAIIDSHPSFSVSCTTKRIFISSDHNPHLDGAITGWNLKADAGTRIHFRPFDLTEANLLGSGIGWTESHMNTLFDIFGGSARLIATAMRLTDIDVNATPSTDTESFIYDSMKLYFGFSAENSNIYKRACLTLSRLFNDAPRLAVGNRALWVLSSSFRHHDEVEQPFWASRFMKFLAGAIQYEERKDILTELRTILDQKGIGVVHEYYAHKVIFANLQKGCHYILHHLSSSGGVNMLKVKLSRVRLIRTIDDLQDLMEDEYGLPTISNYPFVDGVIKTSQGCFLLQMTVAASHETKSKDKLPAILEALGVTTASLVFVLEHRNYDEFKPVKDLQKVEQFKMLADVQATTNVLENLKNAQLSSLLRTRNLPVSGNKHSLIERLQEEVCPQQSKRVKRDHPE
jgi:hypothetical protein